MQPVQFPLQRVQWACAHAQQRLPQPWNIEREQGGKTGRSPRYTGSLDDAMLGETVRPRDTGPE